MIMKFAVISTWSSVIKYTAFDFFRVYTARISGSLGTAWSLSFLIKPFGIGQKYNLAVNSTCVSSTLTEIVLATFPK